MLKRPMVKGLLLVFICVFLLIPLWMVRYPPLVDYPNHLARYYILAHLKDSHSELSQFYRSNWGPYPYVDLDFAAVALQRIFPIDIVGKLILSVCVVGLPLAAYFFLLQVDVANKYAGLWSLAIAYGPIFFFGFLNDILSEALCFAFLGTWLIYLRQRTWKRWLLLLCLATLLYFTHLVGFGVAGLVVLVYGSLRRDGFRRMIASLSVFIPSALVHACSSLNGSGANYGGPYHLELGPKFLRMLDTFRGYSHVSTIVSVVGLLICVGVALWKNPDLKLNYPWLVVVGVLLVCYFLTPPSYHMLDRRFSPILAMLAICTVSVGRRAPLVAAVAIFVAVVHWVDASHAFISQQPRLERLAHAIAVIPPHSRVLTMTAFYTGEDFRRPYVHFWAYGVIERGWFAPSLFHAQGIHPLAFRLPAYIPAKVWEESKHDAPDWQLVQKDYDYLWVLGIPRFSAPILSFAELVYSDEHLQIFKISTLKTGMHRRRVPTGIGMLAAQPESDKAKCILPKTPLSDRETHLLGTSSPSFMVH